MRTKRRLSDCSQHIRLKRHRFIYLFIFYFTRFCRFSLSFLLLFIVLCTLSRWFYLLLIFHSLTTAYFLQFHLFFCFFLFPLAHPLQPDTQTRYVCFDCWAISRFIAHHKIAVSSRNLFNFEQCEKSSSHCKILFHSLHSSYL